MTGRELWELTDAEIWGQVDHAWIMETFRRNELSEARQRREAIAQRLALDWDPLLARYAAAVVRFAQQINAFNDSFPCLSAPASAQPRPKRDRKAARPRQCPPLTAALQVNARPLQQAHLPRPAIRRTQHR